MQVGYDDEGMPIGIQFMGPPWSEATLLRAAFAMEVLKTKLFISLNVHNIWLQLNCHSHNIYFYTNLSNPFITYGYRQSYLQCYDNVKPKTERKSIPTLENS